MKRPEAFHNATNTSRANSHSMWIQVFDNSVEVLFFLENTLFYSIALNYYYLFLNALWVFTVKSKLCLQFIDR